MTTRRLFLVLIALKATMLAIDPTIRLYLGDSAAYLAGGRYDHLLPRDRSFVYSLLIRESVTPFESLWALLFWQTLAGVFVALLLWRILVRHLAAPRIVAFVVASALALEPAQLYYERMVLAETFGLFAFAGFFAAASAYLASGRATWLPAVAALGLVAASLRLNYLPVVLVISLALPLIRVLDSAGRPPWRALVAHGLVAVCSVAVIHTTYRHSVAVIFDVPPSYLARAGFMRMGLVTPLINATHLKRVGLPADVEERLLFPLSARRARLSHMWSRGGLVYELRQRKLDVERIAGELSRMAIADDPFGLVRLGLQTLGDYFDEDSIEHALENDLGRRDIPPEILYTLREDWGYDATGVPTRVTLVSRYFERGTWWLVACLFLTVPLAVWNVLAHWRTPQRPQVLLAALVGVGLVMAHVLFVNVAFYRYLHPLPFFLIINAVPLVVGRYRSSSAITSARR